MSVCTIQIYKVNKKIGCLPGHISAELSCLKHLYGRERSREFQKFSWLKSAVSSFLGIIQISTVLFFFQKYAECLREVFE